jgi:cob(I)alamin adenosyltransferase
LINILSKTDRKPKNYFVLETIMRISTRKGDSGYTSLLKGGRVPKHHLIIEAGGTLDEANSLLAVARASSQHKRIRRIILQVQKHLFIIGSEFSVSKDKKRAPKKK